MKNLILTVLVLIVGILTWRLITKEDPDPSTVSIAKTAKNHVALDVENINKKVGENGIERALFEDAKQVLGANDVLTDSSQKEVDSLKTLLKIKDNQLIAYTGIVSRFKDSLMKAKNSGDSLYTYSDKYASISFNRPDETFSLQYDAQVNMAEYWKRDWFLAPKKRYVELWMNDPRATINGVKRLRVDPKPENFALKLKGVGEYNAKHQEVYFGPGIEIETRRFEYEGQYLYDYKTNKWYPGFKVGFKVFEF